MSLTLTIAGVDKTDDIIIGRPITIRTDLNSRSALSFALRTAGGSYRPATGAVVELYDGATLKFAGTIDVSRERDLGSGQWLHEIPVTVVDYSQLLDKCKVAQTYETPGQCEGDIIKAMIAEFFASDGITTNNVEDGRAVVKVVCPYIDGSQVADELAALGGKSWYIDELKDMHYFTRSTNAAPFGLTATSGNWRNMEIERARDLYRNVQYVRAGTALADAQTESFKGDGATRSFLLSLPCGAEPSAITVNSVAKTIGIYQVETGFDYYWNKGSNTITQDASGNVLTSSDTLAVTYQGSYPLMTIGQLDAEIAARAAVEGGSGRYEAIEDAPYIDDEDMATDLQRGLLERFGTIPEIVTFETDTAGLRAGQLISIEVPIFGASGTYLIESVKGVFNRGPDTWTHSVKALSGESFGGWIAFFKKLEREAKTFVIRENEVILLLRFGYDGVECSDTVAASSGAPETRLGPGFGKLGFMELA